jgi:hypothetical protein
MEPGTPAKYTSFHHMAGTTTENVWAVCWSQTSNKESSGKAAHTAGSKCRNNSSMRFFMPTTEAFEEVNIVSPAGQPWNAWALDKAPGLTSRTPKKR